MTIEAAIAYLVLIGGLAIVLVLLALLLYGFDYFESNNAAQSNHKHDGAHAYHNDSDPVASAIATYDKRRHTHEQDRARREYITIRVLAATGGFALLAAVAAIASAWIFQGQLTEMKRDRRAWIEITQPITEELILGNHIGAVFSWRNVGKEPAADIKNSLLFDTFARPASNSAHDFPPMETDFCRIHPPKSDEGVTFPNTTSGFEATVDQSNTIDKRPIVWDDTFANLKVLVRAQTCFSYFTLGAEHFTWGCFVFDIFKRIGENKALVLLAADCPGGGAT